MVWCYHERSSTTWYRSQVFVKVTEAVTVLFSDLYHVKQCTVTVSCWILSLISGSGHDHDPAEGNKRPHLILDQSMTVLRRR